MFHPDQLHDNYCKPKIMKRQKTVKNIDLTDYYFVNRINMGFNYFH